jgi:hypothetical protein
VLIFLLVAVFLLAGCGVGAVEAEEKLTIGFVQLQRLPFPSLQAIPERFFRDLQIPVEALTDLATARVSTALRNERPLKLFTGIVRAESEEQVSSPYYKMLKEAAEKAAEKAADPASKGAEKEIGKALQKQETQLQQQQEQGNSQALVKAIAYAVKQNQALDELKREGRCALATQRMIQEAWAYYDDDAYDDDAYDYLVSGELRLGLFPLQAPSDPTIDQWVDTQGRALEAREPVKNAAKAHMKGFRNQLWYPPEEPPTVQPPLNPVGYAQVAYANCPSTPLIAYS